MEAASPVRLVLTRQARDDGTPVVRLSWTFPQGRVIEVDRVERVAGWPEWQSSGREIGHIGFKWMLDGVYAFMAKELDATEAEVEQSWLREHDPNARLAVLAELIVHVIRWRAGEREVVFRNGGPTGLGWYRAGETGSSPVSADEDRMLRDLGSFLSEGAEAFDEDPGPLY